MLDFVLTDLRSVFCDKLQTSTEFDHARTISRNVSVYRDPEMGRFSYALVHDVVTIIELLSPTNKRPGTDGRQRYVDKLKALMKTKTHYVELNCCAEGSGHRFPSHLREIISRRSAALNGDRLLRFMDGR